MVDDATANEASLQVLNRLRSGPIRRSNRMLEYLNVVVPLPADKLDEIARQPDVISIQPYVPPHLFDERQDQIVAGNLTGNLPSAAGYLGLAGFPRLHAGAVHRFGIHGRCVRQRHRQRDQLAEPFRLVSERRLSRARAASPITAWSGRPTRGSTLTGCDGHGTINGHIIGGFSNADRLPVSGCGQLRIWPGRRSILRVGSSVIFDPTTSPVQTIPNCSRRRTTNGAGISSNSWGADTKGVYDVVAQCYDALVRDAQPAGPPFPAAGNQQMVIVFANGNAGTAAAGTVGSPATAKNVISVGAAENVRRIGGLDGCAVNDPQADSANDMVNFSSRGPCADGRMKPDIVGPGHACHRRRHPDRIARPHGHGGSLLHRRTAFAGGRA